MVNIGGWQWLDYTNVPGVLDWVAFVSGVLGLLLGLGGIAFTICQISKSRGALEAAKDALETTRSTLIKNQLASILPRFEATLNLIENAINADQRNVLQVHLLSLRKDAIESIRLLELSDGGPTESVNHLQSVANISADMHSTLFSDEALVIGLKNLTATNLLSLHEAIPNLHDIAVELRFNPGHSLEKSEGE